MTITSLLALVTFRKTVNDEVPVACACTLLHTTSLLLQKKALNATGVYPAGVLMFIWLAVTLTAPFAGTVIVALFGNVTTLNKPDKLEFS